MTIITIVPYFCAQRTAPASAIRHPHSTTCILFRWNEENLSAIILNLSHFVSHFVDNFSVSRLLPVISNIKKIKQHLDTGMIFMIYDLTSERKFIDNPNTA
jgi:hypothetical protein